MIVVGDVNSTLSAALDGRQARPARRTRRGRAAQRRSHHARGDQQGLTDALSTLLFATCSDAIADLAAEGISAQTSVFVGNPMIDTLEAFRARALRRNTLRTMGLAPAGYVLATLHRPSNVDDPEQLGRLCAVLSEIADMCPVVFPIHARTRKRLETAVEADRLLRSPAVHVTGPLGYLDFLALMAQARLVLTDSGGVQEETTVLGVPCLTVRTTTERPVTVSEGTNRLVDPYDRSAVLAAARSALDGSPGSRRAGAPTRPELWDGHAAGRIVAAIAAWIEHSGADGR